MAAVTICSDFGTPQNKVCHCYPIYLPWSDGTRCHEFSFLNAEFQDSFSLSSFTFIKRLFSFTSVQFSSVAQSVVSDSLWLHESQHARPPCPSPSPGVYSNSCPLRRWCHPAISSSVVPFFSCPQSLPASESFPVSQLFTWGGQSTGVSVLASF